MKKTILVVDDEKPLQEIAKLFLLRMGFDVITADDGGQALDIASRIAFDLVLSDIDMPNLDGISLAENISPDTPVILMTGNMHKNLTRIAAMKRKISAVLEKPFSADSLKKTIDQL